MGLALLFISVPFLVFGIILSKGKGAALLAGYNTMSEKEKAEYDEMALCKFMGKIMYGVCISVVLSGISEMFGSEVLLVVSIVFLLILIGFALFYTNSGNRFKKKHH
ncbi:DUF3784 domain-containing protein [Sporosarcina sp. Te-1]|uniref:DUF3784 domain-containing protein n=1 Tax=Sporosarcina sp. Te-1 TaxID=2818390 RepID=UPI001A9DD493|nr:DUF3784 domain-containing protein [Sporosarcina sp. Te-1]QTD41934.1 DUF3784 domain-containing protein [Sporosarcina sp. Te-1]